MTGLCAPSVLMPDWNQVQVSISSTKGNDLAISRIIAFVVAIATSCSGTPAFTAATQAAPPTSQTRAPSRISFCSSTDLIVRIHIEGWPTSTNSTPGSASLSWRRKSRETWSNSIPTRLAPAVSWRIAW